jgi:polar amino acid transport system substrate-binding protein
MKKIVSLSLVLLLCLGLLAGCGGDQNTDADKNTDQDADKVMLSILDTEYKVEDYAICVAKENTDLLDQINAALAELTEDGTTKAIVDKYISDTPHDLQFQQDTEGKPELTMATNAAFPPYEFYENGEIVGIDAEMAAAIADKLDMKLKIDDMDFDAVVAAVQSGKADMGVAGMTVTEERLQSISFTESYATGIQVIVVPEGSPITSLKDLTADGAEYLIGVQRGTTGDIYASDDFGDDRVKKYTTGADAIQALVTEKVDCVIIDNEPAKAYVEKNNG